MDENDFKRLLDASAAQTQRLIEASAAQTQRRFDQIDATVAALRNHIDATAADLRLHFDIVAEGARNDVKLVAEKITMVDEKLDREAADIRAEMRQGFSDTQAMIRATRTELDRRVPALE